MTTARITLPELEQYLAKAADILRGSIDQADFKAYIFPLMFFKRISDVYLEEYEQALDGVRRRPRVRRVRREPPVRDPRGLPVGRRARSHRERRHGAADRVPRDREGQPRHAVRHLRQRQLDQQGQAARPQAGRPDRALLHQDAVERRGPAGRVRQRLRVPDQAVRRPVEQEGRRVLHPALGGRPAGQHPRPAGG